MVVDDEVSIRGILTELLAASDYDVVEAPSVEVALVKMTLMPFDLVISDIRMAGQSGLELLKKVKEMNSDTEVIIMTSHASLESALEAIHLGAYDYLVKPFEELEYVESVVSRALSQYRLKKENKALLAQLTEKNHKMEQGSGRASGMLVEIAGFYKMASSLLKSKTLAEMMPHLEEGLRFFSKGKPGIVWRYQPDRGALVALTTIGLDAHAIPPLRLPDAARVSHAAMRRYFSKGEYKTELNKLLQVLAPQDIVHQPMIYQEKAYGLITVMNRPPKHWPVHEKNAFVHLCLTTAMMCDFFERSTPVVPVHAHGSANPSGSSQSRSTIYDDLTGLVQYDCFLELLHFETMRARRYRQTFTLLLLRLDFSPGAEKKLETIQFLQEWAKHVLGRIRATDIAARDRNKIFVLLPETSLRESRKLRRALKRQMASLAVSTQVADAYGEGRLAKAVYPKDGDKVAELIATLETRISIRFSEEDSRD